MICLRIGVLVCFPAQSRASLILSPRCSSLSPLTHDPRFNMAQTLIFNIHLRAHARHLNGCSSSPTPIGSVEQTLFGLPGTRCSAVVSPCSISFSTPLTQYEAFCLGIILDSQLHSPLPIWPTASRRVPHVFDVLLSFSRSRERTEALRTANAASDHLLSSPTLRSLTSFC
jgi:hypothetical protein